MNEKIFSLAEIWNAGFEDEKRKAEARDRIWATELNKMDIDIILKMKGIETTNEASDRAKRKFETGDLWEWFISLILKRAGIFISAQDRLEERVETGLLSVSGRIDFKVGGKPDLQKAFVFLKELELPEKFMKRATRIIAHIDKNFPGGVPTHIEEIKTCSLQVFERLEQSNKPSLGYSLQLYHYVRCTGMYGKLTYICKDDSRMKEFIIFPGDEDLEKAYIEKITRITEYYKKDIIPEKEKPIEWDIEQKKFFLNTKVGWSNYLTLNYDIKDETEFGDIYRGVVDSWNTVIRRIINGQPMTQKNLDYIEKMEANGFIISELLEQKPFEPTAEELKLYKLRQKEDKRLAEIAEAEGMSAEELEAQIQFLQKKKDLLVHYVPAERPKAEKAKKVTPELFPGTSDALNKLTIKKNKNK